MTPDKAIRVNKDTLLTWNSVMDTESKEAIQLGIEALKRLSIWRSGEYVNWRGLLPGETK